jgi:hypothetical protein
MKRELLVIGTFLFLLLDISCSKHNENEPEVIPNQNVIANNISVKTFQVCHLVIRQSFTEKYTGTFARNVIELIKTSDSTLSFIVPDVPEGDAVLRFDLTSMRFKVTKTIAPPTAEIISSIAKKFDDQVKLIDAKNLSDISEINAIVQFRDDVLKSINALPETKKREVMMIYEANKEVFKSISTNAFARLNGTTTMNTQADCPRINFKDFYSCTANNLGNAASDLIRVSKEFASMAALSGLVVWIAPAALGLAASAAVYATYLFMTEVLPSFKVFLSSTLPFLEANWIFSKALFLAIVSVFQDQVSTGLNLLPTFRSLSIGDSTVSAGCNFFLQSFTTLQSYWQKLPNIVGKFPLLKNKQAATTLSDAEISITNISNSNVQLVSKNAQQVSFKSLSGKEETFSYTLKVTKQGFTEQITASAKVLAATDSTEFYKSACLGKWTVKGYDPVNPTTTYQLELFATGKGTYTVVTNGIPKTYSTNWNISKSGNEYRLFENGFWHPAYNTLKRDKLTYPITSFKTYANFDPNFVSQEYIKN